MGDPKFPPFLVTLLPGQHANLRIPDEFFTSQGKNELMKVKLTSDASDKTWLVKLNGRRLAAGWEDFFTAHCLRDDDVLVFRHEGDMVFHVSSAGRSFSQLPKVSSSSSHREEDSDGEDDDTDSKNISSKKKPSIKRESSSSVNSCLLTVTSSNLRLNRVSLQKKYAIRNGLNKRWCEIGLMNQRGKLWDLYLRHNNVTGQDYISRGWRTFCQANGLKPGSCYRFKLVKNGTTPLLQLCSQIVPEGNCSKPHGKSNVSANSNDSEGDDDDSDHDGDSGDDDDGDDSDSKKKSRFETESSSSEKFCVLTPTPSNLHLNRVRLSKPFSRANGLNKRCYDEIDLLNQSGKSWTLDVRYEPSYDETCIRGNWRSFCHANKLKTGYQYPFKLVKNGTRPVLQLCSDINITIEENRSKSKGKANVSAKFSGESGSASEKQNNFLTVTFKPYMLQSGLYRLPRKFTTMNGIEEAEEIILVDKTGFQWPSYLASSRRGEFYMSKNWLRFCEANESETGETFTLEFVPGHGSTPMFKFCSSVKIGQKLLDGPNKEEEEVQEETEPQLHKRARVSEEGGPSRHTQASNNSSADPTNLQRKQPFEPCSISVQLTKVKQNIVDTITGLNQFQLELVIKENNLKATLLEIDALGKRVSQINQFFK